MKYDSLDIPIHDFRYQLLQEGMDPVEVEDIIDDYKDKRSAHLLKKHEKLKGRRKLTRKKPKDRREKHCKKCSLYSGDCRDRCGEYSPSVPVSRIVACPLGLW